MKYTELSTRMKRYEDTYRIYLPRRSYVIIRIDGKAFHSYTKNCEKPYDEDLIFDMQQTTLELCKNIQGAKFAFTQSDEINICVTDFDDINTSAWFDNNLQKIVSVGASIATAEFNKLRMIRLCNSFQGNDNTNSISDFALQSVKWANFDARAYIISDRAEVLNFFLWRQRDWTSNSIQMMARSVASHKECQNKNTDQLQELIFQKSGQNWNNLEIYKKRGTAFYKKDGGWIIDKNIPMFNQDWYWFNDKIIKLNN